MLTKNGGKSLLFRLYVCVNYQFVKGNGKISIVHRSGLWHRGNVLEHTEELSLLNHTE
jgi:hypothetical protein